MHMGVFGDSYDFVKRSLLQLLGGDWSIHPMFTESVSSEDVTAYEALLGAKVVSTDVLEAGTDRRAYLGCAARCGNLFLDPDTGLRMRETHGRKAPKYLFAHELRRLVEGRPTDALTMTFDQSLRRGSERSQLESKLRSLGHDGLFGYAYVSHASFVIVGRDRSLVEHSLRHVLDQSRLPQDRLLQVV